MDAVASQGHHGRLGRSQEPRRESSTSACRNATARAPQVLTHHRTQSFFSSTPKSCIGFLPFVQMIAENKGPMDLMNFFLGLITPPSDRLLIAAQYHCWEVSVKTALEVREREAATQLIRDLKGKLGDVRSSHAVSSRLGITPLLMYKCYHVTEKCTMGDASHAGTRGSSHQVEVACTLVHDT